MQYLQKRYKVVQDKRLELRMGDVMVEGVGSALTSLAVLIMIIINHQQTSKSHRLDYDLLATMSG